MTHTSFFTCLASVLFAAASMLQAQGFGGPGPGPAHGAPQPGGRPAPAPAPRPVRPVPAPIVPVPAPVPKPVVPVPVPVVPVPAPKPVVPVPVPVVPVPAPKPVVPVPVPVVPVPVPAPKPTVPVLPPPGADYRPGFHQFALRGPYSRDYYAAWPYLTVGSFYYMTASPDNMQIVLPFNTSAQFQLEENSTTGFQWFARYDVNYVRVQVDHLGPQPAAPNMVGVPGSARVTVTSAHPGDTVIELVYAREWEWVQGIAPAKVIQLFVHID